MQNILAGLAVGRLLRTPFGDRSAAWDTTGTMSVYRVYVNKTHQVARLHLRACEHPNCVPKPKPSAFGKWEDVESRDGAVWIAKRENVTVVVCKNDCLCATILR